MSDLKDFEKLAKKLRKIQRKAANEVIKKGARKMAQVVRKEMKQNAPKRTGTLIKNLKYSVKKYKRGGYIAKVGAFNDAYYAKFLEEGAKPHRIPKKKGKKVVLNGKVVQDIQHPGITGNKFLSKSFEKSKNEAIREAGKIMFKELLKL